MRSSSLWEQLISSSVNKLIGLEDDKDPSTVVDNLSTEQLINLSTDQRVHPAFGQPRYTQETLNFEF
jgi:hypothetical protein